MDVEEAPGFVQQEAKEEPDKTLSSWVVELLYLLLSSDVLIDFCF